MCVYCVNVYVYINTHTPYSWSACYSLFSTDLNKIVHIKEKIVWIIKMTVQKFTCTWFLILCCYLNDHRAQVVFFCLVVVVHESLVCPEQFKLSAVLQKILQLPLILWFSSIFVYLNPFQQWLYDFEIHLFTLRTTEGLYYNYYRRFKRSLMLQKENPCIKHQLFEFEDHGKFNLFCLLENI